MLSSRPSMTPHRGIAILFIFLMSAAIAQAQSIEIFASTGYGRTFRIEDENPGSGVFWGFGVGFRPLSRVRLEGAIENLDVLSKPRDHVANLLHPRASLAYEFSTSEIRPFIVGGAGAARVREIKTITFPARVETREETETNFAVHFGGGFAVHSLPRLTIRPQFIVLTPMASRSNVNLLHVSVQVGFNW